jgi:hypothetical protein
MVFVFSLDLFDLLFSSHLCDVCVRVCVLGLNLNRFMQSFFKYLWLVDSPPKLKLEVTSSLHVLEGNHEERAIVVRPPPPLSTPPPAQMPSHHMTTHLPCVLC